MTYRITIVGAGNVGRALGVNLMRLGHPVTYAIRTPDPDRVPEGASVVPIQGAAAQADLVILAIPFSIVRDVVPTLGLAGTSVVIDATNPFGQPVPDGFASGAALVASLTGGAPVVKAFNVLGAEHMSEPALRDGFRPLLPVASDNDTARDLVTALAGDMGFDAVEVGGLEAASTIEAAAVYWGLVALRGGRGRQTVLVAHQRRAH